MTNQHEVWCDIRAGISNRCNCIASDYIERIAALEAKLRQAIDTMKILNGKSKAPDPHHWLDLELNEQ